MRESHTSPDGKLELLILQRQDEITLGFDGCSWHTHGDVLAGEYALRGETGLTSEAAIKRLVAEILENRAVLVLSRVNDLLQDVWVTYSPAEEFKHATANESIECRYWNGDPWVAS